MNKLESITWRSIFGLTAALVLMAIAASGKVLWLLPGAIIALIYGLTK